MKIHLFLTAVVVMCFGIGRFLAKDPHSSSAQSDGSKTPLGHDPSKQVTTLLPTYSTSAAHPRAQGLTDRIDQMSTFLPKVAMAKTLLDMARIENVSMTKEHAASYRSMMQKIASDPENSFDILQQSIEVLPKAYETERIRFLQIAMAMDVSQEQKRKLLEKVMLDGRYSGKKIEDQLSKLTTFDLVLEYGGPEAAQDIFKKGQFKGELAKALKAQLKVRRKVSSNN
jgi:hypothetical protein